MIARTIQIVCALYLVAMSLAVATHWWSLRSFRDTIGSNRSSHSPINTIPAPTASTPATPAPPVPQHPSPPQQPPHPSPSSRDEFYASLLRQIENLQNQNRDLIDQVAETNRELMKLEFRVDTHSSQFRPLPVSEERHDASIDDSYGVLPPRPLVIDEPFAE